MKKPFAVGLLFLAFGIGIWAGMGNAQEKLLSELLNPSEMPSNPALITLPSASGKSAAIVGQLASVAPPPQGPPAVSPELRVPSGIRLVVFSPHPDDESLGAAGLIQRVAANGGQVHVVFMTNGDGYEEALRLKLHRKEISSREFIDYGNSRQEEAVKAIEAMGLEEDNAIFFSFPDGGLDDLWSDNWSEETPYTSPHTHLNHPQYNESFSRWAKYAGTDLRDQIVRLLDRLQPDWVVIPDPRDDHPDHFTTGIFVLDALREMYEGGEVSFPETQVFTYLIHYKDYPSSSSWTRKVKETGIGGSPAARGLLSQTQWLSLSLTQTEIEGKQNAVAAHASQSQMLGWFFKLFLTPREYFGRLESMQVLTVPQEYTSLFHRPSS